MDGVPEGASPVGDKVGWLQPIHAKGNIHSIDRFVGFIVFS
jgi:hypothetical protein